jgi:anti-anti-sigma factor
MTAFSLTVRVHTDYREIVVFGPLDLATVERIKQHGVNQLLEPATHALAMNLTGVTFIDSTGLGALVRLRNVAGHVGKQLVLLEVPGCVQRLLDLTGLDAYFEQITGDDGDVDLYLLPDRLAS